MTKLFKRLVRGNKRRKISIADFYQESVNKVGREQLQWMVTRGLKLPIVAL